MHDSPTEAERLARLRIEERTTAGRQPGALSSLRRQRRTRTSPRRRGDEPVPGA